MMAAPESMASDIRKFEEIGTHPASQRCAITEALTFHESIGAERKAERLRYLRKRWSQRVRDLPGVKLLTSDDPEMSCGIGLVSVAGFDAGKLSSHLFSQYRIMTTPIVVPGEFSG